jgi:hypothetical protein
VVGWDRVQYFAHLSDVADRRPLAPGQRVAFEPIETPKGPRAVRIEIVERRGGRLIPTGERRTRHHATQNHEPD